MAKRTLRTRLCDLLGIEYPVLSAGMGPILLGEKTGAPVELVVAVSEAGGCGVLGAAGFGLEELSETIREIKKMTGKPFGVDLLLPKSITSEAAGAKAAKRTGSHKDALQPDIAGTSPTHQNGSKNTKDHGPSDVNSRSLLI
jgi:NAD(P)H-dependent flavin oxidoreductase YrpB (nitropropane dioxygenase family)